MDTPSICTIERHNDRLPFGLQPKGCVENRIVSFGSVNVFSMREIMKQIFQV